jgi:hypothetical protein
MGEDKKVAIKNIELRADWLSWRYDVPKEDVLKALLRTQASIDETLGDCKLFTRVTFRPSLETTMLYLKPQVALRLFLSEDMSKISDWLEHTEKLFGQQVDHSRGVEELCSWEYDSYILPPL